MSKSLGNFVGLQEDALSMYSKLEKVPDELVNSYLNLLTDLDINSIQLEARELQKFMALTITSNFHDISAAKAAQRDASKLVSGSNNSLEEIPELSIAALKFPVKAFYLISFLGLATSSSEAKRKIQGGGVRLDGEKITNPNLEFSDKSLLLGKVLQLGKKIFRKISN